jgi:hypothetical protein
MKRYAKDLEFWILPDPQSFALLQEIRSEVPSSARFLVGPQDPGQMGGLLPAQTEEGLILDLSTPSRYEWLDTHQFTGLLREWELENEPRLLAAEVGVNSHLPLSLAAFMRLAWQTQAGGQLPEALIYRLVLPTAQWEGWRAWRDLNQGVARRIHERTPLTSGLDQTVQSVPGIAGQASFEPSLALALRRTLERLDLEDLLRPLLRRVTAIPEGIPLEAHHLGELVEIQSALADLAEDPLARETLEALELRAMENLRDRISLLLSEARAGVVWSAADVPDLRVWLELLRDG